MPLHKHIKVPKRRATIPDSSVWICHVERANELAIVDQLHFLVITLEKLRDSAPKEVHSPVGKRVIANANAACFLELRDEFLVWIVVQVVDDEVGLDASVRSIGHLLEGYPGHCFVIHIVRRDANTVPGFVYFVPQEIPKAIVVLIYSHFLLGQNWLDHFILS